MSQAPRVVGWSVGTAVRRSPYWLLAKRSCDRLEVFTTGLADGRRVLPVFSFEAEAALFLCLGAQDSWRVRRTGPGELVSLLYGPCRQVELVALDPLSDLDADVINESVSLKRKRFVDFLLHREASVRGAAGAPPARSSEGPAERFLGFRQSPASYLTHRRAERPLL